MTQPSLLAGLGRRERQIVEAVYRRGQATVSEVLAELPDPPSYSAVRAMLGKLERKGYLHHGEAGARYVYLPAVPAEKARRSALRHLVDTFFEGSAEQAVLALAQLSETRLPRDVVERLEKQIRQARKEGR